MMTDLRPQPARTCACSTSAAILGVALALLIAGCAAPRNWHEGELFPAFAGPNSGDRVEPAGPAADLRVGADYPGPIPRAILEQRMRSVVRIEVRENLLRQTGRLIGAATVPAPRHAQLLAVGELVWYSLAHQAHPLPYRVVGTGFFIRDGGYIVTNDHVIDLPGDVAVKTWDGRIYAARRLGRDPLLDLAVLQIHSATAYPVLPLADSRTLARGDYVLALGHAFGFDLSLAQGIVSGTGRPVGLRTRDWMIQIDADINPGNSGGPLLNAAGDAVGVNDAAFLWGAKAGFAQPSDLLAAHLDTLILGYTPERAGVGAEVETIDDRLRAELHLPVWQGVLVASAAAAAPDNGVDRLLPGDLILAADGLPIHTRLDWEHALLLKEPGQTIQLRLLRPSLDLRESGRHAEAPADSHPGYRELTLHLELYLED